MALPDLRGWARGCGRVDGVWRGEVMDDGGGDGRGGEMKPPGWWSGRAAIVMSAWESGEGSVGRAVGRRLSMWSVGDVKQAKGCSCGYFYAAINKYCSRKSYGAFYRYSKLSECIRVCRSFYS